MTNTRAFCDEPGNDHALVPPIVDVRDNLGTLAVQVLAAKYDLAAMNYEEMLHKLYEITESLHSAYDRERLYLT